ncbi:MAG: FHA domain-containing protein, partial [Anaerolineae bacterium]|nr:FHA domain-containing protein [Anaerolineae bacterium]
STQLCPTCAHINRPGVLFCENCGTNLSTGQQLNVGTRDLRDAGEAPGNGKKPDSGTNIVQALDPEEASAIKSAGSTVFESSMSLRIEIEGGATPVLLKPQPDDMILGRRDPTTGATPEVDLTPYAGYRMGVSRKHASLRLENNELNLWDLGSSNGTFLNGSRLTPHRPYTVRDGDEIRLGQMVLRLFFQSNSSKN